MNNDRLRRITPFIVAIMLFLLAMNRPDQRVVWIALGIVFLLIGFRRSRLPNRDAGSKPPEAP
jgi:hypothetical protein